MESDRTLEIKDQQAGATLGEHESAPVHFGWQLVRQNKRRNGNAIFGLIAGWLAGMMMGSGYGLVGAFVGAMILIAPSRSFCTPEDLVVKPR